MNQQILIMQPILPRAPIALISLGLGTSLRDAGIRKEFSYTPLSLFFNQARLYATEPARHAHYVCRDGGNINIAPRFEFIIQLASSLKLLSDNSRTLVLEDRDKQNGNHLGPIQFDAYRKRSRDQVSLMSIRPAKHYSSSDESDFNKTSHYLFSSFLVTQPSYIQSSLNQNILKGEHASKDLTQIESMSRNIDLTNNFLKINSPVQSSLQRIYENLFYLFKASRNGLILIVRGNQELDKLNNSVLEIRHSKEILAIPYKGDSEIKTLSQNYHGKGGMLPISVFHQKNQFFLRNKEVYLIARHLTATFSQQRVQRLNEINSSSSLPFLRTFVKNTFSASYEKQIRGAQNQQSTLQRQLLSLPFLESFVTKTAVATSFGKHANRAINLNADSSNLQPVRQRQSGAVQERLISPPQLSYCKERKQSLASIAPIDHPVSTLVNTPKIDIDRLSRDVLNQIEKRIRIERERRGRL